MKDIPTEDGQLEEWVREQTWEADYRHMRKVIKDDASRATKGESGERVRSGLDANLGASDKNFQGSLV